MRSLHSQWPNAFLPLISLGWLPSPSHWPLASTFSCYSWKKCHYGQMKSARNGFHIGPYFLHVPAANLSFSSMQAWWAVECTRAGAVNKPVCPSNCRKLAGWKRLRGRMQPRSFYCLFVPWLLPLYSFTHGLAFPERLPANDVVCWQQPMINWLDWVHARITILLLLLLLPICDHCWPMAKPRT